MNINAIIIGASIFLVLLGFVIGYLLGWRAGHLTGIDYALKIWFAGGYTPPTNKEMEAYTADVIKDNDERLNKVAADMADWARKMRPQSVKEETLRQIEEMRKSGLK